MYAIYRVPVPSKAALSPRPLLRDQAFEQLRDAIVNGTFEPGEQLREIELQGWLGVSRTPIREALAKLQQAGLVAMIPGRSTIVTDIHTDRARQAQSVVASMHELAVRAAVPALTADDIAAMRAANTAFAEALDRDDAAAALTADDTLHAIPVRTSGNAVLADVIDQYAPLIRRVELAHFSSHVARESIALHAQMIDRCEQRDADGAAQVALNTWQSLPGAATAGNGH